MLTRGDMLRREINVYRNFFDHDDRGLHLPGLQMT